MSSCLSPATLTTDPTSSPSDPTTLQPGSIWSQETGSVVAGSSPPGGDEKTPMCSKASPTRHGPWSGVIPREAAQRAEVRSSEAVQQLLRGRVGIAVNGEPRHIDGGQEPLGPLRHEAIDVGHQRFGIRVLLNAVRGAAVVADEPLIRQGVRLDAARAVDHLLQHRLEGV